jgi:hypothetical protein
MGEGFLVVSHLSSLIYFCIQNWLTTPQANKMFAAMTMTTDLYAPFFFQKMLVNVVVLNIAAIFVKLTLFYLYLRLFKPNRLTRYLVHGGIVAVVLFYVAANAAYVGMFVPRPGEGGLLSNASMARLKKHHDVAVAQGVFSAVSDIYMLAIPLQLVWQLHMSTSKKIGVSAVFMTGLMWEFFLLSFSYASIFYFRMAPVNIPPTPLPPP